jgi:hypothetical protein
MQPLVGTADMGDDRQVVGPLVEQHGAVGRDEPVVGVADALSLSGMASARQARRCGRPSIQRPAERPEVISATIDQFLPASPAWDGQAPNSGLDHFAVVNHSGHSATVYLFHADSGAIVGQIRNSRPGSVRELAGSGVMVLIFVVLSKVAAALSRAGRLA